VKTRTWLLGALILVLLVGCVGVAGFYRQRSLKEEYATAYEESLARHAVLERFQYLVQEAQDAILLAGPDHRIIDANDRATELYGYSREEFLKLRFDDIVPPETREKLQERLRATEAGELATHETVGMRKDGSHFAIEVSDKTFTVDGQQLTQAIIRDISDRKKSEQERLDLERQLQHSQRLESLGVLAGGIAHDFNNILTTILGNADLVLHEMPLSAPGRRGVQEVVAASRRAADLCRQMLAYSGRGQFIVEETDLRALIEDMLNLVRSSIPKDTLLNLNLARNLPHIRSDVSQINQVVMNLVINAAEAIGDRSGVITISTGAQDCTSEYLQKSQLAENIRPGLYVTLEVSDTGDGMSKETLSQIFEPFFTTKFTGRGLGLSAVLGIIRGHKGAIRVYSEPGKGTSFKVLLPAAGDIAESVGGPAEAEANWKGGGTVLVADDEETIRTLGKLMLERLGFNVLLAADGREAVEIFEQHADEISLVVLDLTMPRMNGEEAFRALKELRPGVRVVLSSGYSESEIAARFAGKGPAGFIQKPYTLAALRVKVKQALS
jgi:two-component system cell cycle sensor histidine kinase/response regulator CckA